MNNEEAIEALKDLLPLKFSQRLAVTKAIAALSAQPQVCCGEYATCLRACTPRGKWLQAQEPAKLPEVEEWIKLVEIPADTAVSRTEWVIRTDYVRSRMEQLTAAHAAELAKYKALEDAVDHELAISLEATISSYPSAKEAVKQLLDWHSEIAIDPRVSSAARALIEQGRQEALQGLPVDALIYATLLLRLEAGNIESVVSSKTVSTYDRQISRLIESVRAAQQEETK
jgi:hypothetical protein